MSASGPRVADARDGMTRRGLLRLAGGAGIVAAGALVGGLTGCRPTTKADDASPLPRSSSATGSPDAGSAAPGAAGAADRADAADLALARSVAEAEQRLIDAYDDAARAHPELAGVLAPLRADHEAHRLGLAAGAASAPAASSSGLKSSPPPSSPSPSAADALAALAALERAAAAARVDDLAKAGGPLARLLASIGGCEASHAALLDASIQPDATGGPP